MTKPAKLPVWKTTRECYRLSFQHLPDFIRFGWIWLLAMLPTYAAWHAIIWVLTVSSSKLKNDNLSAAMSALPNVPEIFFLAAVAVAWHRLLLRDERPVSPALPTRMNKASVTYAGWVLALYAIVYTTIAAIAWLCGVDFINPAQPEVPLPSSDEPASDSETGWKGLAILLIIVLGLPTLAGLILLILASGHMLRLSLKFPAIALDEPVSFQKSWHLTQGNTWRLGLLSLPIFLTTLLVIVPFLNTAPNQSLTYYVAHETALSLIMLLPAILGVTSLSLIYRFFTITACEEPPHGHRAT